MKAYRLYAFDFDYTLADSETGILLCFRTLLNARGFPGVSDDAIRSTIGMPMQDALAALTGESDAVVTELREEFRRLADRYMTANTVMYPAAAPALERIHAAGAMAAIVSNKTRFRVCETLGARGMADAFDLIIGPEDVKNGKPDPEGLLLCMKRLGVTPGETLYIGDSIIDAETALRAGTELAAVTTGCTPRADFVPYLPVLIIDSLDGLLPSGK